MILDNFEIYVPPLILKLSEVRPNVRKILGRARGVRYDVERVSLLHNNRIVDDTALLIRKHR